jgi:hypothetical protein
VIGRAESEEPGGTGEDEIDPHPRIRVVQRDNTCYVLHLIRV